MTSMHCQHESASSQPAMQLNSPLRLFQYRRRIKLTAAVIVRFWPQHIVMSRRCCIYRTDPLQAQGLTVVHLNGLIKVSICCFKEESGLLYWAAGQRDKVGDIGAARPIWAFRRAAGIHAG